MNQPNQTATQKPKPAMAVFKSMVESDKVQKRLDNALGKNKNAFVASLLDMFGGDAAIQRCDAQAVVTEALKAASLQLPINKALGFAYIVVYNVSKQVKDENGIMRWVKVPTPTFIPGYKGYIQLAMRTGYYKTINADIVYEGELRKVDKLSGTISFDGEKKSDKVVGYFCYFELLNGFSKTLYMSLDDMASYAKKYSPSIPKETATEVLKNLANPEATAVASTKKQVGWVGNFNDMALKTVTRRLLSKYGYLSIEMQGALSEDVEERDIASESRSEIITQTAAQEVDIENAEYEDIDKETGEVKTSALPTEQPETADSESEEAPY